MKKHFVAAAVGPLVQTAGGVGRETERADGAVFIQPEQPASGDRARQRTSDSGWAKTADHLLIHKRASNRRTDLITAHRAQDEITTAHFLPLREREQGRKNHDAQMAPVATTRTFADLSVP